MSTIVTRAVKGSPLSYIEMDANFNNLNSDKLQAGTPGTNIANTPAGTISAVTVQAAINELDGDVQLKANITQLPSGSNLLPVASGGTASATIEAAKSTLKISDDVFEITATASAGALTITLNPCVIEFRSSPVTSGSIVTRNVSSPITITIPSGATLGTTSGTIERIAVLALDNAGTVELAVTNENLVGNLNGSALITTVAINTSSDSAVSIYSNTLRSNVAYKSLGYTIQTVGTAGTWITPDKIQSMGSNVGSLGVSYGIAETSNNNGSINTAIRRFSAVGTSFDFPITIADSATLGTTFTINIPGLYHVHYTDSFNAATGMGITLNETLFTASIGTLTFNDGLRAAVSTGAANYNGHCSWSGYLKKGDVLRAHSTAAAVNGVNPATSSFYITHIR